MMINKRKVTFSFCKTALIYCSEVKMKIWYCGHKYLGMSMTVTFDVDYKTKHVLVNCLRVLNIFLIKNAISQCTDHS